MCGRFVTFTVGDELVQSLSDVPGLAPVAVDGELPGKRWNVAPTMPITAVAGADDGGTVAAAVRWGLVPHWSKSMPKTPYFNARAETWREKPVFRDGEPCAIPMDGWYEWRDKAPFFVAAPGGRPMLVAGLWARCGDIVSATILTTDAVGGLADLHHRMPRVLADDEVAGWLGGGEVGMTDPALVETLTVEPANRAVGNVANDGEWLLEP
ncbi:SOS response-associated peptidase [Corynebacterium hansenii]|uniref:Abasic site processing protein n=1 Tax=Corynebacterium hansenii TaxID=394964 RepID=A0ABV7ZMH8_9CORY|nr:SOS response-associated peptidase [Corynebacterium hansenii]WJY99188.1 Putative SOS response-associated peptidase YedK [Corynebacterium hansenii]